MGGCRGANHVSTRTLTQGSGLPSAASCWGQMHGCSAWRSEAARSQSGTRRKYFNAVQGMTTLELERTAALTCACPGVEGF